jgi:hypothetical protein
LKLRALAPLALCAPICQIDHAVMQFSRFTGCGKVFHFTPKGKTDGCQEAQSESKKEEDNEA